MEMCHYIAGLLQVVVAEILNHLTSGIAEQHRLNIIPLATDTIEFILFPKMSKYLIFSLIQSRIIHQNGDRTAFDFPTTDAELQALSQSTLAPIGEKFIVLDKIKRLMRFFHHIGANRNVVVAKQLAHFIRFCGKHRIDATNHVAYFPTGFKKVFRVFHIVGFIISI